jgi:GT2 family glycosyltransferase
MSGAAPLAVQIVNYRTRSYLERCLATVIADLERSGLDYEVALLDNDSGESLDDLAARYARCRAFAAPTNLGFGGGHNLLARQTEAPYLLFLNPDVELVSEGGIARLLDLVRGDDRVKVVGPKLLGGNGYAQRWDHGRLHGLRAQISLRAGHGYWRETDRRLDVAWVSGAVMLIERAAFDAVGGFDENFFLYKEDEDLCLRVRQAGGRVLYEPSVVARHTGQVAAKRGTALAESTEYFIAKHRTSPHSRRLFEAAHRGLARLRL